MNEIPRHIAIIPDGNRRWAKQQGLSLDEAYHRAYENLKEVADLAFARGVSQVSAYVFSTENWQRDPEEVNLLMGLAAWAIDHDLDYYKQKNIRLVFPGSRDKVSPELADSLQKAAKVTAENTAGTIGICFNYGGRNDLVEAIRQMVQEGTPAADIDSEAVTSRLTTAGLDEPDMIIRTSGEHRLSNFMIWEGAYSELYFTDELWPDFGEKQLDEALADYRSRTRRFGT